MRLREAGCRTALCLGLSPKEQHLHPGGGHRMGPPLPASTFRQHLYLQGQQQEVWGGEKDDVSGGLGAGGSKKCAVSPSASLPGEEG